MGNYSKVKRILLVVLALMMLLQTFSAVHAVGDQTEDHRTNIRRYNADARTEKYLLDYCLQPSAKFESEDRSIVALSKEITAGISSNYEKAKAIHDWVCNNISYDYDFLNATKRYRGDLLTAAPDDLKAASLDYTEIAYRTSAIGTLEIGRTICSGYASLSVALLRAAGIPAKYVTGMASGSETVNHAWTEAYVDKRWIIMDTTWDSGNKWEGGKVTASPGLIRHQYFDPSLEAFSKDHVIAAYKPHIGTLVEDGKLIYCGNRGEDLEECSSMEDFAFRENKFIKNIVVPEGVKVIQPFAFSYCDSLTSITLPKTLRTIKSLAFYESNALKTIDIANGLTHIDSNAFSDCLSIESVTLPDTLLEIGGLAFSGCVSLKTIDIPEGTTTLGEFAFAKCTLLESVTIPGSVRKIGRNTFFGCDSLKTVNLLNGVAEIPDSMFMSCYQLTELLIPPSVNNIDPKAFETEGQTLKIYGVPGSTAEQKANEFVKEKNPTYFPGRFFPYITFELLSAQPTASRVLVDGDFVAFDAYSILGNNYFKLRDLAYILSGTRKQFDVGWEARANAIKLTSGFAYSPTGEEMKSGGWGNRMPVPTASKIILDGKSVNLTAYTIDGSNYFKLRDIGQAFNFGVSWNEAANTISIDTNRSYSKM